MMLGACAGGLILALGFAGVAAAAPIPVTPLALADVIKVAAVFDPTPILIQGPDRYQTAVEASKKFESAATVVVATGELFPDALGGAALAGAVDGPILLTRKAGVPAEVLAEITRLKATKIYVLGSTEAVSAAAFAQLDARIAGTPVRIGGPNRYDTANLVAAETIRVLGSSYTGGAFLATGLNFPDALAAGPIAAAKGMPIILSNARGGFSVPAAVSKVKILGSTSVVPASVQTALGAKYDGRLSGANRYATAKAVAEYGVSLGMVWNGVGLATGENFPDALCAGPLLGKNNTVLLLTTTAALQGDASAALGDHKLAIDTYHLFGGLPALSSATRTQAATVLRRTTTEPPPVVGGSHDLPDLFCAGSGCHDTDLATIHLLASPDDTFTCAPCHAAGVTPRADCVACHGTDVHEGHPAIVSTTEPPMTCTQAGGCHGVDAIAIHATCATCHNATTDLGDGTCETCHDNPHPDLSTVHTRSGGCYSSTCHGTDVTRMHAVDFRGSGEEPPGCAACHGPGVTPSTDCSRCHLDIDFRHNAALQHAAAESAMSEQSAVCVSCHSSDLMAVLPPTPIATRHAGCVCHAQLIVAGQTACESCHPTTDHTAAHEPVTVSDSCDGAGCHVGTNLLPIHGNSTCATCHESGDAKVIAAIAAGDFRCVSCHGIDAGAHLALHSSTLSADCAGCHDANLVTEHEPLPCATCHESGDAAVIAAIAAGNRACAACHGGGAGSHGPLHDSGLAVACAECHQANLITEHEPLPCAACHDSADPAVTAAIAAGNLACTACHGADAGTHRSLHEVAIGACSDCHVGNLVDEHEPRAVLCEGCHASTDPLVIAAIATEQKACTACHDLAAHPYPAEAHAVELGSTLGFIDLWDGQAGPYTHEGAISRTGTLEYCTSCHSGDLAVLHAANGCATCHPAPRDTFTSWNGSCQQGGCHVTFHDDAKAIHNEPALENDCGNCHTGDGFEVSCYDGGCHP